MTRNNYTCGIDIGTHTIRVVVMGFNKEANAFEVLGVGASSTEGVREGYITNTDTVANSLKKAITQAEKIIGYKIKRAYVSLGGINLSSSVSTGSAVISRADQEITQLDITKALADSEENIDLLNKKIVHIIPLGYKLDGKDLHGRPEGMKGIKLEVKTLFVTCLKQNIEDLVTTCALAHVEIEDIIAAPLANSLLLLSTKQKTAGCALLDIGFETVSLAVFENNLLLSLQVFPLGSMDITKDIALGFKISLEEAESIKLGSLIGGDYPKKKVDEIIEARLGDILELVGNHLKRLRRNELLPAGIIITGGASYIQKIEELTRSVLKLPARVGPSDSALNHKFKIRDNSWYIAYGLATSTTDGTSNNISSSLGNNIKEVKGFFKSFFSQLLP